MSRVLRVLALLFFLTASSCGIFFTRALVRDAPYYRARLALARHPGNMLYQTEYQMARARHLALLLGAIGSGLVAVVAPALFLPLAELLDRTAEVGQAAMAVNEREGKRS